MPIDTDRLVASFRYAAELHRSQLRKGTDIPYISHLMAVAAIVLEQGGDEDRSRHCSTTPSRITPTRGAPATRSGHASAIASPVSSKPAPTPTPTPSRPGASVKERYLEHLPQAPREARLIVLADKLHNARAILADHRAVGERVWERFKVRKQATLWYYRALADAFARLEHGRLTAEFERVVAELEKEARQP